ncbi:MAG: hypothetical protein WCH32_08940 [Pseudomonadota bacterium]
MSHTCRQLDVTSDEWAIATVEVSVPQQHVRWREPLLVDLPCPTPAKKVPELTDFECEVLETAELARYASASPRRIRARAHWCGWCVVVSTALAVGTVAVPVVIWLGTVPVALAVGFGWQWAVLTAAAKRLERDAAHA